MRYNFLKESKIDTNKIDIAVMKYFKKYPYFLWVLAEIKTLANAQADALPQMIRYYEIFRDESISLLFPGENHDTGYFPAYGLEIIQNTKVVLYGFATLGTGKEKKTCHSIIKEVEISSISAVSGLLTELRQRVENLKKLCEPYFIGGRPPVSLPFPTATLPCFLPSCVKNANYKNALSVRAFECTDSSDSTTFIVKFPSRSDPSSYLTSIDAHKLMAGKKLAPKILHEETKEGMKIVVMEKIEGTTLSAFIENPFDGNLADPNNVIKVIISKLQSCLNVMHSSGYVHGDLRGPNILIVPGKDPVVKIIDFDWACSKSGLVCKYPELREGLLWPAMSGAFIWPIHDSYHFAQLKAKLLKIKKMV